MSATHLDRSARIYQRFREQRATRAKDVRIVLPKSLAVVGYCDLIGYVTTYRGRTEYYVHEFAPGSRPYLATGSGRGQLFLVGGRYRFTGRGITDLSLSGRAIDARPKYKVTLLRR